LRRLLPYGTVWRVSRSRRTDDPVAIRRDLLIVDDNASLAGVLESALRDHHAVRIARSCQLALAEIAVREPDVILCNLRMPAMSGPQFHTRLLAERSALAGRTCFHVGNAFSHDGFAFIAAHPERVVLMPVSLATLLMAIERAALEKDSAGTSHAT